MHDEASTHYHSMIDQHSLGAEFLRDTFGDCARPKIGWQIDPFGHSRESASLFAQVMYVGKFYLKSSYYFVTDGFRWTLFWTYGLSRSNISNCRKEIRDGMASKC